MKTVLGVVLGVCSGVFVYMMATMVYMSLNPLDRPGQAFVLVLLVGGSIASAVFLARGAATVRTVWRRGFLLGAVEWAVSAPAGAFVAIHNASTMLAAGKYQGTTAAAVASGGYKLAAIGGFGTLAVAGLLFFCFTKIAPVAQVAEGATVPVTA
ncbi:MAG TPA: hypothetical protein VMH39_02295 [Gemmatimonadaceae bacterium]|nr:hypothetical protein [Gemmatimonadaceae bacterium]